MSEPMGFPWPPTVRQPAEDEDAGALALRHIEDAIDLMDIAGYRQRPEDWTAAADALYQASWLCRFAAAPLYRAQREANEAAGLIACSHCGRHRPATALERHATGEEGKQGTNHWYTCQDGCRDPE